MLRNYGSKQRYCHEVVGVNSRLDPLQAALLSVKLPLLEADNARRAQIARTYRTCCADLPVGLQEGPDWVSSSWHLFVIRVAARDRLGEALAKDGVQCLIHYPVPPHRQGAYAKDGYPEQPLAEAMGHEVLSLPMGPHLSDDQVSEVVAALRRHLRPPISSHPV